MSSNSLQRILELSEVFWFSLRGRDKKPVTLLFSIWKNSLSLRSQLLKRNSPTLKVKRRQLRNNSKNRYPKMRKTRKFLLLMPATSLGPPITDNQETISKASKSLTPSTLEKDLQITRLMNKNHGTALFLRVYKTCSKLSHNQITQRSKSGKQFLIEEFLF